MRIELCFPFKAFPLNMAYSTNIKTGRRFKSKRYKEFEIIAQRELLKYFHELKQLNTFYSSEKHYFSIDYRFYHKVFNKKDGLIGKTSSDISNLVKPIEDIIFTKLKADDSQIMQCSIAKIHSEEERIEVSISVKDISLIK